MNRVIRSLPNTHRSKILTLESVMGRALRFQAEFMKIPKNCDLIPTYTLTYDASAVWVSVEKSNTRNWAVSGVYFLRVGQQRYSSLHDIPSTG